MNYHLSPISFRTYSLILISAFFFIAILESGMEIYFENLEGDLTRVGYFSERDFGWKTQQPPINLPTYLKEYPNLIIPAENFKDYPLAEADILVIGDSFSLSRMWQTKLTNRGFKVATLSWSDLGAAKTLRPDLGKVLRSMGFKGRYVVIESIERVFQVRMKSITKKTTPIVKRDIVINSATEIYLTRQRSKISMSKLNGGDWGIKTLYNKIKLEFNSEKYLQSGKTLAVKFDGCRLFSNKLCNYALFTDEDFKKESFSSINNVLIVNQNLQSVNIKTIWLVVPDKATVYLGYGELGKYPYVNIWQRFSHYPELIAPNLGAAFITESKRVKDFYLPNNTHLSTVGYLFLGELVRNSLHSTRTDKISLNSNQVHKQQPNGENNE